MNKLAMPTDVPGLEPPQAPAVGALEPPSPLRRKRRKRGIGALATVTVLATLASIPFWPRSPPRTEPIFLFVARDTENVHRLFQATPQGKVSSVALTDGSKLGYVAATRAGTFAAAIATADTVRQVVGVLVDQGCGERPAPARADGATGS